jgi:protein-disulfide isomerase
MRSYLSGVVVLLTLGALSGAQQPKPSKTISSPLAAARPTSASGKPAVPLPSEETVNGFMQDSFGYDASISWKIVEIKPAEAAGLAEVTLLVSTPQGPQSSKLYVTTDGEHALVGDLIPFGLHPFLKARKQLEKGINGPSRGPANAPVTLVEFSDLQCPHCRQAQPTIDKLIAETPNARLVFQHFPLPNHDWASKAAGYADCIGRGSTDAFWKFVQQVYEDQGEVTAANADAKLNGFADAAGTKSTEIAACAAKTDTVARLEHSLALGKSVGVTGTPTLFINGRRIASLNNVPYEVLKQLVDFAAKDGQ